MVALSHATARELGYRAGRRLRRRKRPFVEVSGRKGLGVKADDLLDTLIAQGRGRGRQAQPGARRRASSERIARA